MLRGSSQPATACRPSGRAGYQQWARLSPTPRLIPSLPKSSQLWLIPQAQASDAQKAESTLSPRQRRLLEQKKQWLEEQAKKPSAKPSSSSASSSKASNAPARKPAADVAGKGGSKSGAKSAKSSNSSQAGPSAGKGGSAAAPTAAAAAASQPTHFSPWSVFEQQSVKRLSGLKSLTGEQLADLARHWAEEAAAVQQAQEQAGTSHRTGSPAAQAGDWVHKLDPAKTITAASNLCALANEALRRLGATAGSSSSKAGGSNGASSSSSSSSQAGKTLLGRQEHADIAWAVAHFRSLHAATGVPALCDRLQDAMQVPFRVNPMFLPHVRLEDFVAEVKLNRDVILLDGGTRAVPEPRLTGWQSDVPGQTFKYSGKEMQPEAGGLSRSVAQVRDALAQATGVHYDSVLINYYEDGRCGMRYHVDPLYGVWDPKSAVVSIGATRRFAFREASDFSVRWLYQVRNGDVVEMFGDCQDRMQHSVIVEKEKKAVRPGAGGVAAAGQGLTQQGQEQGQEGEEEEQGGKGAAGDLMPGPRMSLVFKKLLQ